MKNKGKKGREREEKYEMTKDVVAVVGNEVEDADSCVCTAWTESEFEKGNSH